MIKDDCQGMFDQLVKWRRDFHQHPELSNQEKRTSRVIAGFLKDLGLEVHEHVFGYGLFADLKGGKPGPTIALRADMDALPIQEETGESFSSQIDHVMHACGHDGHMTVLMGAAKMLYHKRDQLKGTVRFIFQPAEELTPGGAKGMIEAGVLEGVDKIYGIHLWSELPSHTFWTTYGPMMAASDKFTITIHGKGGHGGMPHKAVDALLVASHFVTSAQHIISRTVDPIDSGVVTFGVLQSGTAFNVIADSATLEGTARSFTDEVRDQIENGLKNLTESVGNMYGANIEVDYERGYPPVINHKEEAQYMLDVAKDVYGLENVGIMKPNMAGEDFAYYLEYVPGSFSFVGAGNFNKDIYPHHHPKFHIDENVFPQAVELFCRIVGIKK